MSQNHVSTRGAFAVLLASMAFALSAAVAAESYVQQASNSTAQPAANYTNNDLSQ